MLLAAPDNEPKPRPLSAPGAFLLFEEIRMWVHETVQESWAIDSVCPHVRICKSRGSGRAATMVGQPGTDH